MKHPSRNKCTERRKQNFLHNNFTYCTLFLFLLILLTVVPVSAAATPEPVPTVNPVIQQAYVDHKVMNMHNVTNAQRLAAAADAAANGETPVIATGSGLYQITALTPVPGGTPDYFGPYPNYALSQLPIDDGLGNVTPGTGIRKFVDTLPGLGGAAAPNQPGTGPNNLGQYLPVAVADTISYPLNGTTPAADYYEIATLEWAEQMHSDIPPSTIRGYVQLETPVLNVANGSKHIPLTYLNGNPIRDKISGLPVFGYDKPHYLGPIIIAQKDKPVRIKFQNYLIAGGNLSIPDDTELMGNGLGPLGLNGTKYSQQRATVHLHGGNTPWISDGTQHQWTVPAGESNSYPTGVSVGYVPDMDNGTETPGTLTFYYTNQQSARLMFYHEHAMGITRLGVYAGQAGGYIVQDPSEASLVASGAIPQVQIPLIIVDKSFVPNATQMQSQDPTWNSGGNLTTPWPHTGDFYFPHVYMPNQNPWDNTGVTPMGRWDYAPWVWPTKMIPLNPPVANPYYDPINAPWEPPQMPGVPTVSQVPESYMDTPVINGVAYPKLVVGPHAYRFRILNAANERFFNLQLYYAANQSPMWNGNTLLNGSAGEVPMVPALPSPLLNGTPWPKDGRAGGVPDPTAVGPSWIQIGSEGGFLPAPVVIPSRPIDWDYHLRSAALVNVLNRSLFIGPAERADVIVDFSAYPSGTKLILYNDAPAAVPTGDSRYDYYTGDPDQRAIGGAPTTNPGYGPNTRTLMLIEVNSAVGQVGPVFNKATLDAQLPVAYAATQDKPIVAESAYNAAFGTAYPDQYLNIPSTTFTFTPAGQAAPVTMNLQPKALVEGFDMDYGRITANFGVEIPATSHQNVEQSIGYFNNDPVTELFNESMPGTQIGTLADGTQIWKLTHNGVDTHILHVHMYNLQVINRVYWDGTIVPPQPNELGWKESVQVFPLQDIVVAMRPITPNIPWEIPNSIRPLNAITAIGSSAPGEFTGLDPSGAQVNVVNHLVNFGWEYLWHCHLLGHEENDMMRTQSVAVAPKVPPSGLTAALVGNRANLSWVDNSVSETDWTIQRAAASTGPWSSVGQVLSSTGPAKGSTVYYTDGTQLTNGTMFYQVLATNVVGDRTVYSNAVGYPTMTVSSMPSNVAVISGIPAPVVKITSNIATGVAPLSVRFVDQSITSNIKSWNWSFGDGTWFNTSVVTARNPLHVFATPGTYITQETICNALYCNTTQPGISITVNSGSAPVVKFAKNLTTGAIPMGVKFTDQSTSAQSAINKWNWSFGDGTWFNTTLATMKSPVHTFATPGVYSVQLIACNAQGCNTTAPAQTVTANAASPIIVKFAKSPASGTAPLAVRFVDQSKGTGINSWNWSYGNGIWFNTSVATQRHPTYVYTTPGTYQAQLVACNAGGCNTTAPTQAVTVNAVTPPSPVVAKFALSPSVGIAPLSVRFVDQSTGTGLNSWNWSYGNGIWFNTSVASLRHPTYVYTVPGSYPAQLIACNAGGCNTSALTRVVTVR